MNEIPGRIRLAMDGMRVADVHTHFPTRGLRQARTLADIVSYHWLATELTRAAEREFEASPHGDPEAYLREVVPHFAAIRNTSNHYAMVGILRDLYGFDGRTLTEDNWRRVDEAVRSHADDPAWVDVVLDRARIEKLVVPVGEGAGDLSSRYVPYETGEDLFMASTPDALKRLGGGGGGGGPPKTLDDLEAAITGAIDSFASERGIRALHVWCHSEWTYAPPDRARAASALEAIGRGGEPSVEEGRDLTSFSADATAAAAGRHGMVIQLFHGMTAHSGPGPGGGGGMSSDCNLRFLRSLAPHFAAHPETRYDLFLATRIPGHEAASLARVHYNLMVSGAWWHAFTPTTLTEFFRDRLEMLPTTAWNAFYSDGYIVEWVYGKLLVTKNRLAVALAGLVEEDFLTEDDAVEMAGRLLYDNAVRTYGM